MSEQAVFNSVRAHLAREAYSVVQLVTPGGQAPYSITVEIEGVKRVRFPDMIAVKDATVLVGELKPGFSKNDYAKVLAISADQNSVDQLLMLARMRFGNDVSGVKGVLCHSDLTCVAVAGVDQWVCHADGISVIPQAM